jgi:hypothetical protein
MKKVNVRCLAELPPMMPALKAGRDVTGVRATPVPFEKTRAL